MRDNFIKNCYKKILAADSVYDIAVVSPTQFAPKLSSKLSNHLFIKREDLQPVFSFKLRGAYNKISKLKNIKHIVAASAGNHAQGVAMTCKKLKLQSSIVMPLTPPTKKIDAVPTIHCRVMMQFLRNLKLDEFYLHYEPYSISYQSHVIEKKKNMSQL